MIWRKCEQKNRTIFRSRCIVCNTLRGRERHNVIGSVILITFKWIPHPKNHLSRYPRRTRSRKNFALFSKKGRAVGIAGRRWRGWSVIVRFKAYTTRGHVEREEVYSSYVKGLELWLGLCSIALVLAGSVADVFLEWLVRRSYLHLFCVTRDLCQ